MKIICIGRNYADHAKELNNAVPEKPVWFMKPDTALLKDNAPFYYPEFTKDLHYECELVLRVGKAGRHIDEAFASGYIDQLSLGIDFTARDVQDEKKKKGLPWEEAKAFDGSAVLGKLLPAAQFPLPLLFTLEKNGETVQYGNTEHMLFSPEKILAYVSQFVTLKVGDLIYTGTPAGVGPVKIGDRLRGKIGEDVLFDFEIK
jgi:2-keto-4-pentenoate hydratase/2-oxohepta-3-ene-1,7-dioic acid hydratase in catechol pathway